MRKHKVHAFFLGNAELKGVEMAELFTKVIPKIIALIEASGAPVRGIIRKDGRLDLLDENFDIIGAKKKMRKRKR